MSPPHPERPGPPNARQLVARAALAVGLRIREERTRRRWTLSQLGQRAGLSVPAVHSAEGGRVCGLETYVRLANALGLSAEILLTDPRQRSRGQPREADLVHAALGELEAAHLSLYGFSLGIDEPYQHYHFAGRADVLAWDVAGALLHIENRTSFPNLQDMAGSWNAKRSYLAGQLAGKLELRGWRSVTHVMVALWTAEVLHTLRLRRATFRALCPHPMDAFTGWWSGSPPLNGVSASLVVLDPLATGRQRLFVDLDHALRARPRHRDYAEVAAQLRLRAGRA